MSEEISGYGMIINLVATSTFPVGFDITQFADDADPFDVADLTLGDTGMGLNGDLVAWTTPNPIEITISVIPGSSDDNNLAILMEANRAGKGKRAILDSIIMSRTFPDDSPPVLLTNGKFISGPPLDAVSSSGRKKSKSYVFRFENKVGI